jgi:hypothetical protein
MQDNKEGYFHATIYCPNSFIYLMHKKNGFFLFSPHQINLVCTLLIHQSYFKLSEQYPLALLTRKYLIRQQTQVWSTASLTAHKYMHF